MNLNLLYLNKLRKVNKPFFEKIPFYLTLLVFDIDDFLKNSCRVKTAYVHPAFPSKKTSLYKILRKNNISIINENHTTNIIKINFIDETFQSNRVSSTFHINDQAYDISKHFIDSIHEKVFEYSTLIDPITYTGKGVEKSNLNAKHDGKIIQFPLDKIEVDKIYQIIIDNSEDELYVDYRVCLVKSEIPIIYKKYKTEENRFTNNILKAELALKECIPIAIQEKIIEFCKAAGCNFCELDVLKDNLTNLWYVIDINKTPYGPPAVLSKKDKKKAVQILSESFYQQFIK
jgi:hypothetical protein